MNEKDKDSDSDFDSNFEEDLKLTEKSKKQKNNSLSIEELKEGVGFGSALKADSEIIQKPLNILVLDGSGSGLTKSVSDAILGNGLSLEESKKFPNEKVFCNHPVQGSGGAQMTRCLCDKVSSVEKGNSFEKLCEGNFKVEDYDVIIVIGLCVNSDKGVLDFIANKIKNGQDDNLIVYGDNYLSNNQNMNWFKYHLKYEMGCKELLKKIASFDKDSKKFVGWEGEDKDDLDYEQNKFEGLKGTAGEIAPKVNPKVNPKDNLNPGSSGRALNVLKNHYGKMATGVLLLEEIFLGGIRKNLPKIFKSKEIKNNNREKKGAEGNKSLNNDAKKEETL